MTTNNTARFASDPRVDRALTWGLTAFAGCALTVGAYFFRDLSGTVKELGVAVSELRTEVAVLRVERKTVDDLRLEVRELNARIRALEIK